MNTTSDVFWVAVIGVVACFAFFVVLGAVTTEAVGLIAVMCGLAVLWVVHSVYEGRRSHSTRGAGASPARERRGF